MSGDSGYDGVFLTGVSTTGIFCRPSCTARKPLAENVEFFPSTREALLAGYRPCKRCRPMEPPGEAPPWLQELLKLIDEDATVRWTDQDLRDRGLHPDRVRRWFQKEHGMTFHAYHRARRLGLAMGRIRHGSEVTASAFDHGFESLSGFNEAFQKLFGTSPGRGRSLRTVTVNRLVTPLGPMVVAATEDSLCLLEFADRRMLGTQLRRLVFRLDCTLVPGENEVMGATAVQLDEYLSGERRMFSVPMLTPGTEFQRLVWDRLLEIPYGSTVSYLEVARDIGRETAVRAVAAANGDNRIAILIPCHRVVGSDGKLTGYGGGLWRKKRLLDHEQGLRALIP
jgi:AraC family transcriptional regulator of adaptative response/methylated-DNA-[protein]-cysteine methyltransferase